MTQLILDHLAVAGGTLDEAADWVAESLDLPVGKGGRHAHFGTHNRLVGLSDGLYLEAIAIDPMSEPVQRPRWFDLDRLGGAPRLQAWVCRTDDLAGAVEDMPEAGQSVALERGDLKWRMAVPGTGILPYDNCFPALMQWDVDMHPARLLPPTGARLRRLTVRHPEAEILRARLLTRFADDRVAFETGPPALSAVFDTPAGRRELM